MWQNLNIKYCAPTQNDIHGEVKSRVNSGDACHHSIQNIWSASLLSKNLNYNFCCSFIQVWNLLLGERFSWDFILLGFVIFFVESGFFV